VTAGDAPGELLLVHGKGRRVTMREMLRRVGSRQERADR
jgi:hypothetical protein